MQQQQPRIGVEAPIPGVVYPPQEALERYVAGGALGFRTLPDALRAAMRTHADKVAISAPEGSLTFSELDQQTDRAAAALLKLGLKPLDAAIFQLANSTSLVVAVIACWKAGILPVCTLAAHREHEIGYLANHTRARAHFVLDDDRKFDHVGFAMKMRRKAPTLAFTIVANANKLGLLGRLASVFKSATAEPHDPKTQVYSLRRLIDGMDPGEARTLLARVQHDPFQAVVFQLSGGTTGVPKVIPRMHNEYLYNMELVARHLGWSSGDAIFYPPPMMHNANMVCGWGPALLAGVRNIIVPEPDARDFARVMMFQKPTWIGVTRAILMRISDAVAGKLISFKSLRGVMSMNASELVRKEIGVFGAHVFGMTEGVVMMTHRDDSARAQDKTVGRPLSPFDEVKLLVPGTENEAAEGEVGELAVRGAYTIHGYFDAPEQDARAFTSDGFYRSGDLMSRCVIEGKTYYVFEGRIKDVVDRGGEKISCEEVELAVGAHAAVADCAVVPMPCETFGERACAFVVPRNGRGAPALHELQAHLQGYGLAKFKWPERIEEINALPTTKAGKPDKQSLRSLIAERVGAETAAAKALQ
ncbi:AMP-binding protein [Variovorax sp. JS1663]|uniref:AMP-binding protein n=1 Tax=Variovorax sp. JS1663 TaxID=1851577 RepID=UPI000B348349|nr:AMP-binding protein [Variovorax sp. JS1663]OUM02445.1 hypothetical protein A8M77_10755 [Variovorax sp. JS1663]OUM02470.1 hypothetical protein A8M77_10890 [Variovorax sp. JS1663]